MSTQNKTSERITRTSINGALTMKSPDTILHNFTLHNLTLRNSSLCKSTLGKFKLSDYKLRNSTTHDSNKIIDCTVVHAAVHAVEDKKFRLIVNPLALRFPPV